MSADRPLTPSERSQRARIAALTSWGNTDDRAKRTGPGTRASLARFDRMVPDDVTDPAERARRADAYRKAHFAKLALASAQARRRGRKDSKP